MRAAKINEAVVFYP